MDRALILGAGPAGLAAATTLARRGVAFTWLERGSDMLAGLRKLDPDMRLLTPLRLSRLPHAGPPPTHDTYLRMGDLCTWLERHAAAEGLAPITGVGVERVVADGDGFQVRSRDRNGEERVDAGRWVINCTGVASWPRLPAELEASGTDLPWHHSRDLRAEHLAGARRLLVVGDGTSAREAVTQWLRVRPGSEPALVSVRSPSHAVPHRLLGLDTHYLGWLPEHLPASTPGLRRLMRRDPTIGLDLSRALLTGKARRVGAIAQYGRRHLVTADGIRIEPDLLVLATGYRYAAPHLDGLVERDRDGLPIARRCEARGTPGLFLLGLRFGRTMASPYLRGIASDARFVAERIARAARARRAA